jgi:hypothetical protein
MAEVDKKADEEMKNRFPDLPAEVKVSLASPTPSGTGGFQ